MCRLSRNLGVSNSWNLQGLSRPIMGLLYLNYYYYYYCYHHHHFSGDMTLFQKNTPLFQKSTPLLMQAVLSKNFIHIYFQHLWITVPFNHAKASLANFKYFVPCIFSTYGMKTNWCHYFIRILLDLYMFRAHRTIFRRVRTAVHTTIGSVSVPLCSRALCVVTEYPNRSAQKLNQWLCEQLY